MNSSEHNVSRETVVLYFLDELNSSDRKRVQLAVRNDPEIRGYFLKQLRIFARIDSIDGLSDDDRSFVQYLGLSGESSVGTTSVEIKDFSSLRTLETRTRLNFRKQDGIFSAAASHREVTERPDASYFEGGTPDGKETELACGWRFVEDSKEMELWFQSDSFSEGTLLVEIKFEYIPNDNSPRREVDAGVVSFHRDKADDNQWRGSIKLADYETDANCGMILHVVGEIHG